MRQGTPYESRRKHPAARTNAAVAEISMRSPAGGARVNAATVRQGTPHEELLPRCCWSTASDAASAAGVDGPAYGSTRAASTGGQQGVEAAGGQVLNGRHRVRLGAPASAGHWPLSEGGRAATTCSGTNLTATNGTGARVGASRCAEAHPIGPLRGTARAASTLRCPQRSRPALGGPAAFQLGTRGGGESPPRAGCAYCAGPTASWLSRSPPDLA